MAQQRCCWMGIHACSGLPTKCHAGCLAGAGGFMLLQLLQESLGDTVGTWRLHAGSPMCSCLAAERRGGASHAVGLVTHGGRQL